MLRDSSASRAPRRRCARSPCSALRPRLRGRRCEGADPVYGGPAAGALVRYGCAFHRVADPLRHPLGGLASLGNPVGSPLDKARVGLLRGRALLRSPDAILAAPETSTLERLRVRSARRGRTGRGALRVATRGRAALRAAVSWEWGLPSPAAPM
jgi:hypothetical protein